MTASIDHSEYDQVRNLTGSSRSRSHAIL